MDGSKKTLKELIKYILVKHPDLGDDLPISLPPSEQTSIRFTGSFSDSVYGPSIEKAFFKALALDHRLPDWIVQTVGMSGKKYRYFINNLIHQIARPRYLEIGSWAGSTAISAIFENNLDALCIDNWSQFGGPRNEFMQNIQMAKGDKCNFSFIEDDFRSVNFNELNFQANVYLFDGPHTERDQYDGIRYALPSLQPEFVLVVDDFNWPDVRNGTKRAITDCHLTVEASIEIRTTIDNTHPKIHGAPSDWHNGYFIASIKKQ